LVEAESRKEVAMETLTAHQASGLPVSRVLSKLGTDRSVGLSEKDVVERRGRCGWNEFNISNNEPVWKKYLDQFKNPLIILLLISATISVCMSQFDDAISITLVCDLYIFAFLKSFEYANDFHPGYRDSSNSSICSRVQK
jgi:Ca2+-transporting ATPase